MSLELKQKAAFTTEDIEDVRVIVKAKGKHYGLVPNLKEFDSEESRQLRIAMFQMLIDSHYVVDTPLEDIKTKQP